MMKKGFRFVLILNLFFATGLYSQEMRLVKGKVVDSVAINDTISESYAIYLPQDFENERLWPVIFVFDAEGRGRLSAQLFRSIAEEQGYVIAASNKDLRNDSLQHNLPTASRLMKDVLSSLPIDSNRVYAAGLAEGGSLASAVPLLFKNLEGVLAVGKGWVNAQFIDSENPYFFSAVAGDEDFNMYSLSEIVEFFKKADFPTEINFYDGKYSEWPDTFILSNAITGFTLTAMEKGLREEDREFIDYLFENELISTEMLRRQRKYYQAFEKLKQMEEKYSEFDIEKSRIRDRIKELRRNKAFRQQRREFSRAATAEAEKQEEFIYYLEMDVLSINFENIGWWEHELRELQKQQQEENIARSKAASRLESFLQQLSKNQFDVLMNSNAGIDTRIFISVLRTVLDKEDPEAYLKIIELAGHDGDYETALIYLEDLLKTGFDDLEALYDIDGILDLKLSREYNQKIREYLGESKYYNYETEEEEAS